MVPGTAVAIRLGEAMHREAVRLEMPPDILVDMLEVVDKLIVQVLKGNGSKGSKDLTLMLLTELVDTFAVGCGVGWERKVRAAGLGNDYES